MDAGNYTFTPASNFSGETSFSYSVCDDGVPVVCDTATVYIEVFPAVDPENKMVIANPDAHEIEADQTASGNVMSNDLDPDALNPSVTTTLSSATVSGTDQDGNAVANAGTLTLNSDGSYTFVPALGFTGTVSQAYTICDGNAPATCDNSALVITVSDDNGNSTFANDDALITDAGVTKTGDVSENDEDVESDNQSVSSYMHDSDGDGDGDTAGSVGSATTVGGINDQGVFVANAGDLTLNADGTYSFTPATGFAGNVMVTYNACDDVTPTPACSEATLVITVLDVQRDYGDGPSTYATAWHRALTDSNADDVLDGSTDIWLGVNTDFETAQLTSSAADADGGDDAMTTGSNSGDFPTAIEPLSTFSVDIDLNSAQSDLVFYGMWIDWDNDGTYDDFYNGSQLTNGLTTASISITAPASLGGLVNVRLRADDDPFTSSDFSGGRTNGEVEDFQAFVVLPVELVSFTGRERNCEVELKWETEAEINFSHYEIERSMGGRQFELFATVLPAEQYTGTKNYKFVDTEMTGGAYYRLKMVDLDGQEDYSDVVYVEIACAESEISVFPNPQAMSAGVLNVELTAVEETTTMTLFNNSGIMVHEKGYETNPNLLNQIQVDISTLPAGVYWIRTQGKTIQFQIME